MRIAVLDDEEKIRDKMNKYFSDIQKDLDIEMKVSCFDRAKNLIYEMEELPYDIVFLDIELEDDNGIEIAETLRKRYPAVVLAFITGYFHYVYKVFDVRPCGFIRKPFEREDVKHVLSMALKECDNTSVFKCSFNGSFYRIFLKDIYYVISNSRKISMITAGGTIQFYGKLKEVEEKLQIQSCNFLRISQSIILNTKYLKEMTYKQAIIITGRGEETFNISQKYQVQVRQWCLDRWEF